LFFDALVIIPFSKLRALRRPKVYAFIKILNVLINLVEKGGSVYLDGNKVGTAMGMSTFKTQ
jgi:hypothetical protein